MKTDFINLSEFCQMTGYKKNTVYSYLSRGEIKIQAYRFGRFLRFKRSEVEEFIQQNTNVHAY